MRNADSWESYGMIRHMLTAASVLSLLVFGFAPAAPISHGPDSGRANPPTTAAAEPCVVARLQGHGGCYVGYNADGSRIVTVGKSGLQVWDAKTYKPVGTAIAYPGDFVSAGFADGGHIAYLAHSEGVWLFDTKTGARIGPGIKTPAAVWTAVVSPDGRTAAMSWAGRDTSPESAVHLFDTISGRELRTLRHGDIAIYATFSPDGRSLLTAEGIGMTFRTFRMWDVAAGRERFGAITIEASFNNPAEAMQRPGIFSPDGRRFAVAANTRFAVLDTDSGKWVGGTEPPYDRRYSTVDALAFSADGKWVVDVDNRLGTALCDAATAKPREEMAYIRPDVTSFNLSTDGTRLACSYQDMRNPDPLASGVGIFDLLTGKLLYRFGGDTEDGMPAFSPSGDYLAVTGTGKSQDETTVWKIVRGKQ